MFGWRVAYNGKALSMTKTNEKQREQQTENDVDPLKGRHSILFDMTSKQDPERHKKYYLCIYIILINKRIIPT